MPKFAFVCQICGQEADVEAPTGSEALVPECCGQPMKRVWTTTFHLKGGGWAWRPNDEVPTEELGPAKPRGKKMSEA